MIHQDCFKDLCETEIKTVNSWTDYTGHLNNQKLLYWCLAWIGFDENAGVSEFDIINVVD